MKNLPRRSICLLDRLIVFVLLLCIGHSAPAAEKIIGVDKSKLGLRPTVCTQLPFDLTKVPSINKVKSSQEAKALLSKNGFVVVGPPHGSMPRCYEGGLMPLVTIDSVLEVFLSDFEIAWGALEDKQAKRFARLQVDLWNALVVRLEQLPEGAARVAGQRLLGLVAVGRSLSDPEWTIPEKLPKEVDAAALTAAWKNDLSLVRKHEGFSRSVLWHRKIDWSVFRSIGSYTSSATLRNYYRVSRWWSRHGLRTAEREERLCAGILSWVLQDASPLDPATKDRDEFGFPDDDARKGPLRILKQIKQTYDVFLWRA